ncbi:S-layer protein [Nostoc linckia z18]|uniref:S-layer protein n=2 Tax=Nostoc linckia TaxID=92942 RepID=A0A9Q6EKE9_NOSLI|nr:iron uptake porin [Nostoc linckia]PHK40626.1 S-layer protein [Nostoc linckia z15]PHK44481.1 S-layer protein [Nostoc linckia z16]PHJ58094.1 S-layer protein [Nostoc linckia z1]PHJ60633.1 S-layer protein [Nostoc linckia z3]PHJ65631.1 S-layer protein [Nostoc linckia z2]
MLAWLLVAGVNAVVEKAIAIPTETETTENSELRIQNSGFNSDITSSSLDPMAQVTSVSQLKDVQPSDWAFAALQSLVERYGCIAGYPDSNYRGNRALTRYEFAAGVNACLDRINELIATAAKDLVSREDVTILQKLQEEFAAELGTLRGRIDSLEAKNAEIAANQFSTTTKLSGLLIVGLQGRTKNRGDVNFRDGQKDTDDAGTNINVISLAQLYLTSQITPRSYLLTGLLAGRGTTTPRFTNSVSRNDVLLGYEFPTDNLIVSELNFHWLVTDKLAMMIGTEGVSIPAAFRGPNRVESAATGPLSYFAQRNPILNTGYGHGGIAIDWQFAKRASLQAIYTSYQPGNPGQRSGLFDGNTTTGVQLLLTPTDTIDFSLYYVNNYSSDGCLLTFVGDECLTAVNSTTGRSAPLQTNAVGATVTWQISKNISAGAWGGYTKSYIPGQPGNVETTNYMVFLNFPDLFAKGNLGGIYVGQPPKITSSNLPVGNNVPDFINTGLGRAGGQPGTTTQIEAFYRFQLNDNLSITPGIIHILQPGHTPNSDSVTIGILRSTFTF